MQQKDRAARARAKRLAAMTEEERAAHDRWHAAHKPGSPTARAAERDIRKRDREAGASFLREHEPAPNPEVEALDRQIAELRQLARERELAFAIHTGQGVFG